MKNIILVGMLILVSACSTTTKTSTNDDTPKTIITTGIGKNEEQAKQAAFKIAIESVVGSVLVSNRESRNDKLVQDEIINHSAGYIDSYKIISQKSLSNGVEITVESQVKSSRIANRILGLHDTSQKIDGDKMTTQYKTYMADRKTGDELIGTVLSDYPKKAFNITKTAQAWELRTNRDAVLNVWFDMSWNYNFLTSLNEVLAVTQDGKNSNVKQKAIYIKSKDPKAWLFGKSNSYYFNDHTRAEMIEGHMVGPISIVAKMYDQSNKVVTSRCMDGRAFLPNGLHTSPSPQVVRGNEVFEGVVQFDFTSNDPNIKLLNDATRVDLVIIRGNC